MRLFYNMARVATLLACLSFAASAADISFTATAPGPTDADFATLNFISELTLPQWNPALFPGQTLVSVELEYQSLWQNVSSSYQNTGTGSGLASLTGTFLSSLSGSTISPLLTAPVLYNTGALQTVAPGASLSVAPANGASGFSPVTIAALLPSFIGAGNLTFDLTAQLASSNSFAGSFLGNQTAQGQGQLRITYTYAAEAIEDVPEPASFLLVGTGLFLAGFFARRRMRPQA